MSLETQAIQRFLDIVKTASQSNARDVRIPVPHATLVAAEIGQILSRLVTLEQAGPIPTPTSTKMDGGSFR